MKMLKVGMRTQSNKKRTASQDFNSWRAGKNTTQRGYGYKWQQLRKRHLEINPLCVYCERVGKITAATVLDHIIPHRGNQKLFWDKKNWQGLCKFCHDSIKAKEENKRWD